jgi:hypothetical protein
MRYIDILRAHEKYVAEGKSPHKKGSAKYKKHMAAKHAAMGEAALVTHGNHDLMQMLKSIFDRWQSNKHSQEEITELLAAMGYRIKMDGDRAEIIKEAPGDIRKAIAGIALIASLWGVNNHLAHKAYDASPQLQQLISLHQEAQAAGDEAAAENYADRIEQHKLRLDLGKGEVMGKDGRPIKVKRFGEATTPKDTVADVEEKLSMLNQLRQMFIVDGDKETLKAINDKMRELMMKKKAMAKKPQFESNEINGVDVDTIHFLLHNKAEWDYATMNVPSDGEYLSKDDFEPIEIDIIEKFFKKYGDYGEFIPRAKAAGKSPSLDEFDKFVIRYIARAVGSDVKTITQHLERQ